MLEADHPLVTESPIRRQWLPTELAIDQYLAFKQHYGPKHALLACHAAFPLIVRPELLNLIHLNFLDGEQIPWFAEAEFLLSSLCHPIDNGLYEVEPSVREVLLVDLQNLVEDGEGRLYRLADFLLAYLNSQSGFKQRPDVTRTHQWIAWSYLNPQKVVDDMTALLTKNIGGKPKATIVSHQLQVATMMEIVRYPIESSLPRATYRNLVETGQLLAHYWYSSQESLDRHHIFDLMLKRNIPMLVVQEETAQVNRSNQDWLEELLGNRGQIKQYLAHQDLADQLFRVIYTFLKQRQTQSQPYTLAYFAPEKLAALSQEFVQETLEKLADDNFSLLRQFNKDAGTFTSWAIRNIHKQAAQELDHPYWNRRPSSPQDTSTQHKDNDWSLAFSLAIAQEQMSIEDTAAQEIVHILQTCLERLEDNRKIALLGLVFQKRSAEEVAKHLNLASKSDVYLLIIRAKRDLRNCLQKAGCDRDILERLWSPSS